MIFFFLLLLPVPISVDIPVISNIQSRSIMLEWNEPETPNGIIAEYHVITNGVQTQTVSLILTLPIRVIFCLCIWTTFSNLISSGYVTLKLYIKAMFLKQIKNCIVNLGSCADIYLFFVIFYFQIQY